MISDEVQVFASRIGVDIPEFDRRHPLCFRVDNDLEYCMELRADDVVENEERTVSVRLGAILTLKVPVPDYDTGIIRRFLERASFENHGEFQYTVGSVSGYVLMMMDMPEDTRAEDIENSILFLKREYEEIRAHG